jgi:antibiotic biosynthesis monooxygenase (ABM) superfamily enzyme
VFFTVGNIALIASTFFIVGPLRQLKAMTKPTRLVATVVYVGALALTLVAALYWGSWPLTLISLIIQLIAMAWYIISHIPFAQSCIANLIHGSVAV